MDGVKITHSFGRSRNMKVCNRVTFTKVANEGLPKVQIPKGIEILCPKVLKLDMKVVQNFVIFADTRLPV